MLDIKLGLIGAGPWGRNIIRTVDELSGVALSCIASRNPKTRTLVPAACRIVSNWHDVLESKDIQGVIIATPAIYHAKMVKAAVVAGLATFVEKPLTLDVNEAESLLDLVTFQNGYVFVDHTQLFNPAFQAMKVASNSLGPILSIKSSAGNYGPFRQDADVLWDWGPHDVAMCLDFMGKLPAKITAKRIGENEKGGETVELVMDFDNGVVATINISNIRRQKVRQFSVQCSDGELLFDDMAPEKLSFSGALAPTQSLAETIGYSAELPLTAALRKFVEDMGAGCQGRPPLQFSVDVVRILAQCEAALGEHGHCG